MPQQTRHILVRLPNWLGDLIMATPFLKALSQAYPNAEIDVIVKNNLVPIVEMFDGIHEIYPFDKNMHKGPLKTYQFGRKIGQTQDYDLFYCLPPSFSSALMAKGTGIKVRVGYPYEMRGFLFTHNYPFDVAIHQSQKYLHLLESHLGQKFERTPLTINTTNLPKNSQEGQYLIFNTNSNADSRRLSLDKAAKIIKALLLHFSYDILLIGAPNEVEHVKSIAKKFENNNRVLNICGQTTIPQLASILHGGQLMLSTDSGPAHLGNFMGVPILVFQGAGDEKRTGPTNPNNADIIRLHDRLPCEPCIKNVCKFGLPPCVENLDILEMMDKLLKLASKKV